MVIAEEGDQVIVFGVNDTTEAFRGHLRYGLFLVAGGIPADYSADVELPANESTQIASFEKSHWTAPDESIAFAILSQEDRVVARNRLVLPYFKELKWVPADVRVHKGEGELVFDSDTFAWGVCIDLDGETPLADNFFDLYPGIPHVVAQPENFQADMVRVGNLV